MVKKAYFVTGIGTDVGKTIASAVLVKKLQANYWKPVQCGDLHNSDSHKLKALCPETQIFPETYALSTPASPHYAAEVENVRIDLGRFQMPASEKPLVVEGAGGLMVPLNQEETIKDLIVRLKIPVVVVSRNYLGSINHSLLTLDVLQAAGIPIAGLLFNGPQNEATEQIIAQRTGVSVLGRIEPLEHVTEQAIIEQAKNLKDI